MSGSDAVSFDFLATVKFGRSAPIPPAGSEGELRNLLADGVPCSEWAAQVRDLLEAGCVALFGPGLTGLLLWLKWRWIRRLQRSTSEQLGVGLRNAEVLEQIADADFQTELAQFNVEINVPPVHLHDDGLARIEEVLRQDLNAARRMAARRLA